MLNRWLDKVRADPQSSNIVFSNSQLIIVTDHDLWKQIKTQNNRNSGTYGQKVYDFSPGFRAWTIFKIWKKWHMSFASVAAGL